MARSEPSCEGQSTALAAAEVEIEGSWNGGQRRGLYRQSHNAVILNNFFSLDLVRLGLDAAVIVTGIESPRGNRFRNRSETSSLVHGIVGNTLSDTLSQRWGFMFLSGTCKPIS